jgi:hypothetical protein
MPFKSKKQRKWMHKNIPEVAKKWEKIEASGEYQKGGKFEGPSHKDGGIHIEVEGDEIVINSTKNKAAIKHEKELLALNESPDEWEIVPKKDARKRSKKYV